MHSSTGDSIDNAALDGAALCEDDDPVCTSTAHHDVTRDDGRTGTTAYGPADDATQIHRYSVAVYSALPSVQSKNSHHRPRIGSPEVHFPQLPPRHYEATAQASQRGTAVCSVDSAEVAAGDTTTPQLAATRHTNDHQRSPGTTNNTRSSKYHNCTNRSSAAQQHHPAAVAEHTALPTKEAGRRALHARAERPSHAAQQRSANSAYCPPHAERSASPNIESENIKYGADINHSAGSTTSTSGTAVSNCSACSNDTNNSTCATPNNRNVKVCEGNNTTGTQTIPPNNSTGKRGVELSSPQISYVLHPEYPPLPAMSSPAPINAFSPTFKHIDQRTPPSIGGGAAGSVCTSPTIRAGKRHKWLVQEELSLVRHIDEVPRDEDIRALISALREYVQEYSETECDPFWRRKSRKTVLAVVMVRWHNKLQFFRGINSEISLPAGSNCAERAAISATLSAHLGIARKHFLAVAVVDPDTGADNKNPIAPCGVCEEWLKKIQENSPSFTVLAFGSADLNQVVQRYPVLFVEERTLAKKPPQLSANWTCRCGFEFNLPKLSRCSKCGQSRYRFRPDVQRSRLLVLSSIKILSFSSILTSSLNIAKWTKMPKRQVNQTLAHLQSLKFVVSDLKVELHTDLPHRDDYSSDDEWAASDGVGRPPKSRAAAARSEQQKCTAFWKLTDLGLDYLAQARSANGAGTDAG